MSLTFLILHAKKMLFMGAFVYHYRRIIRNVGAVNFHGRPRMFKAPMKGQKRPQKERNPEVFFPSWALFCKWALKIPAIVGS